MESRQCEQSVQQEGVGRTNAGCGLSRNDVIEPNNQASNVFWAFMLKSLLDR